MSLRLSGLLPYVQTVNIYWFIYCSCHLRYKHLKSTIRQLVLENAALTSEIENTDAQLISAKQERK